MPNKVRNTAGEGMVDVARFELATPAMSMNVCHPYTALFCHIQQLSKQNEAGTNRRSRYLLPHFYPSAAANDNPASIQFWHDEVDWLEFERQYFNEPSSDQREAGREKTEGVI
jgi:hypothetical protein